MPAAAPGTETLSITRDDGSALAVTFHYDPDTRAWNDPAITVDGTGGAVLAIYANGARDASALAVAAAVPIAASVLAAVGVPDRDTFTSITLLAAVP